MEILRSKQEEQMSIADFLGLLGVLAGAGITAVIQSSSASVGILQTLAVSGADCKYAHCF